MSDLIVAAFCGVSDEGAGLCGDAKDASVTADDDEGSTSAAAAESDASAGAAGG